MSKFDLKDKFDNFIYSYFNKLSDLIFFFNNYNRKLIAKNKELLNTHLNEKCFILGTGPSVNNLSKNDISIIKNNVSFAVNLYYKNKKYEDFKPNYYALIDPLSISDEYNVLYKDIRNKYPDTIFIGDYRAKKLLDSLQFKKKSYYIYSKKYPVKEIDENIAVNSYLTLNVVSTCILIAIYMGMKEIYLVGCDYNSFASQTEVHFYEEEDELEWNIEGRLAYLLKFYHLTTEFHYLIAKLAKKKGVKIINLCPHSLLDAYPRADFSKFNN